MKLHPVNFWSTWLLFTFCDSEFQPTLFDELLVEDECSFGAGSCSLELLQSRAKQRTLIHHVKGISRGDAKVNDAKGELESQIAVNNSFKPGTCRGRPCEAYHPGQSCQCSSQCWARQNCCADFWELCIHQKQLTTTGHTSPPQAAPTTVATTTSTASPSLVVLPGNSTDSLDTPKLYTSEFQALRQPSAAKVFTFYMYRAQNDLDIKFENVNAANLPGVMWYLQNEIVSGKWGSTDRFGVSRIIRLKVSTRATQALIEKGMNFGLRVAYDSGQCTNAACNYTWWKYGYNVGCNNLGQYPFPDFETNYPGGVWYSMPGRCSSRKWNEHNSTCEATEPGGRCDGAPTGTGDCTYSAELAGFITLEELYKFSQKSKESFWANEYYESGNLQKVESARQLFKSKYPLLPADLPNPPCDFDQEKFFKCEGCVGVKI